MSDNSTAMAVASPSALAVHSSAAVERSGPWRSLLALLASPFTYVWQSWSTPDNTLVLHELSEQALSDMGASPELLAEAQAAREFELHRAYALSLYHW
ncbi:MAG TPA: hypothetical protein VL522_07440 [Bordetella sp.]|nr:hypothetical protein [Bordetella sp.]